MSDSMMSNRVRDWVNSRVNEGLDWKAIKDLLRIDEEMLDQVRSCCNLRATPKLTYHLLNLARKRWQECLPDTRGIEGCPKGCL